MKSVAVVIAASPGMFTWPGDFRAGKVSSRLSWAVNPFAAHAATPSEPLPSGRNWAAEKFGCLMTTSERLTTPAVFSANEPSCQAVVTAVAAAAGREPPVARARDVSVSAVAAATSELRNLPLVRTGSSSGAACVASRSESKWHWDRQASRNIRHVR